MDKIKFRIKEVFPPNDVLGQWIIVLAMAFNDLISIGAALDDEGKKLGKDFSFRLNGAYYFRILSAHLQEIVLSLKKNDELSEVKAFLQRLSSEALSRYEEVKTAHQQFINFSKYRDEIFHYHDLGRYPLTDVLEHLEEKQYASSVNYNNGNVVRYEFADIVATAASFGELLGDGLSSEGAMREGMMALAKLDQTFRKFAAEAIDFYLQEKLLNVKEKKLLRHLEQQIL